MLEVINDMTCFYGSLFMVEKAVVPAELFVEDRGGWAVLLQQCHPNSAGSLVIAGRTE